MSEFKVGDEICYINGDSFSNKEKVVTIDRIEGRSYWLKKTRTQLSEEQIHSMCRLVGENLHHKHHDLIIAWAKGAEVEWYNSSINVWDDDGSPSWLKSIKYRIKSEKSAAELEKECIIKEMEALKVRLDKLEV